ncbi:MAG TPA: O-antigen ligase family protein [Dinghuibacter sp.]|jgi:O-antigen ligase|uniref:O-antigen ligase family protein n=1 Tax=Dinghuibacter sp. TaxID=2024697 RepID=UPI002C3350B2|nr:O-antigen ligase family protein [Dinghuibacter sp.]HTJ13231.1 O-antigen ligase family protein [Dinghuibacter sp.]
MLKNVSYYLILLFLVCLPLDHFYSEVALIALVAHTALLARREDFRKLLDPRVLVLQSLYGVTLIATVYTRYRPLALEDWFQQLPLLLFPWLCAVLQPVLVRNRDRLLGGLCVSCLLVLLYLYAGALRTILYFHLPPGELFSDHFTNRDFTAPLVTHPTYLSMYCALSLFWCIRKGWFARRPVMYFAAALLLTAGLIQLCVKSVWLVLIGMVVLGLPYFLFEGRRRLTAFAVSGVAMAVLTFVLLNGAFFHKRMVDDLSSDLVADKSLNLEHQSRLVRWEAAWSLIKAAPMWGYGSGSEMPLLHDAYFRQGLYEPFLLRLNSHNQFIRWWITAGLFGVLVYAALLLWSLASAIRARDLLWTAFSVLTLTVSFTENLLDVQQGLFFVAFFLSFFFFAKRATAPGRAAASGRAAAPSAPVTFKRPSAYGQ